MRERERERAGKLKERRQRKCKGRGRVAQKGLKKEREKDAQSVAAETERVKDGGVGQVRHRQRCSWNSAYNWRDRRMSGEDVDRTCKDDFSVAQRDFLLLFVAFVDTNLGPKGPNRGHYACAFVFLSFNSFHKFYYLLWDDDQKLIHYTLVPFFFTEGNQIYRVIRLVLGL